MLLEEVNDKDYWGNELGNNDEVVIDHRLHLNYVEVVIDHRLHLKYIPVCYSKNNT